MTTSAIKQPSEPSWLHTRTCHRTCHSLGYALGRLGLKCGSLPARSWGAPAGPGPCSPNPALSQPLSPSLMGALQSGE